ncbi:MAG: cysteine desulfurase/selenocysteine lyase [Candidatus Krumholzibacteriia bacterium]
MCGAIQPAAEVGAMCRELGIPFMLDVAQTAGALPIDMSALQCDLIAFTGHKSLCGPTGVGGLVIGPDVDLESSRWGGTGVRSAQRAHLQEYPYRLEAGTLNSVGIIGLGASLRWLAEKDIAKVIEQEKTLARQFRSGLTTIANIETYGPQDDTYQMPVIALNLSGQAPDKVGMFLDVDWNIAVRTGLHCAPLANDALGIGPDGSVRFSFGPFNTTDHVDLALQALAKISASDSGQA